MTYDYGERDEWSRADCDRDDDACGPECSGIPRQRHCSDRTCGGTDCSTCYGPGVDHSGCERSEPERDDDDPDCPDCQPGSPCAVHAESDGGEDDDCYPEHDCGEDTCCCADPW